MRYVDAGIDGHSRWSRFLDALKTGRRAILTTSHARDEDGLRHRKAYVGLYGIGDTDVTATILSFDIGRALRRFDG